MGNHHLGEGVNRIAVHLLPGQGQDGLIPVAGDGVILPDRGIRAENQRLIFQQGLCLPKYRLQFPVGFGLPVFFWVGLGGHGLLIPKPVDLVYGQNPLQGITGDIGDKSVIAIHQCRISGGFLPFRRGRKSRRTQKEDGHRPTGQDRPQGCEYKKCLFHLLPSMPPMASSRAGSAATSQRPSL